MRKILQKSDSLAAPLWILFYTCPLWGLGVVLILFMPLTGVLMSFIITVCLIILPFKARRGACPACERNKLFPFSGYGSACKGCGQELVLRGQEIHLLEEKMPLKKAGAGRS